MRMLVVLLAFLGCVRSVEAESGQEQAERAANLASIERSMQGAYEKTAPAVVRITHGAHGNP